MTFLFKCPKCGEYRVEEDLFRMTLHEMEAENVFDQRVAEGDVVEAVISYPLDCPRCLPDQIIRVGQLSIRTADTRN